MLLIYLSIACMTVWRAYDIKRQLKLEEKFSYEKKIITAKRLKLKNMTYYEYFIHKIRFNNDRSDYINCLALNHRIKVLLLSYSLIIANIVIIVTINSYYVIYELSTLTTVSDVLFLQVGFALFKL